MNSFELAKEYFLDGCLFLEAEDFSHAEDKFRKSLELIPDRTSTLTNLAIAQLKLKKYSEARETSQKAISLESNNSEAYLNLGLLEKELNSFEGAIKFFDKALSLRPVYHEAWSNKGNILNELKRYDEAITHYDRALSLRPDINWVYGYLLHANMKRASWSCFDKYLEDVPKKILANEKAIAPFPLLSLIDDPLLHKKASQIYAQDRYPVNFTLGPIAKFAKKEKIRIGYFSADFRNHPVSFLTAELFELHDRNQFEIFAFSFGPDDKSPMRFRLSQAFNQFIDVSGMADKAVAKLSRDLDIDIAVDLTGPMQYSRTGIFSYRAAPIQVNWLGYPGTIGVDFIDYIVADKIVIPEYHQRFYAEKIAYLPNTYMVDDSKRTPSTRLFTREGCGLPKNAFVFCCFNNDYKFNPQVLDSWSRILHGVKNSILWISENNEYFKTQISAEFMRRGIDSGRVIFAARVEKMSDHLARYALADLFLDTYPFNAHTTAIDSLKACIPIVTLMGQSFAGRVAASLLNAIGLPELITLNQKDYEVLAIELAKNPKKLATIKHKITVNRFTTQLFDTPLFAKNLETVYIKMYERYHADIELDHITID